MALTGMFVGCNNAPIYDNRLVEADSLLHQGMPNDALSMLSAIKPSTLTNDGDRAYHALLITQARYICYDVITSDDEINSSISYYEQHRQEQEKLTRSYIYKGAVMEELGKPDTAMIFYKQAQVNATDNNDYFNLGYALLRMGNLYTFHHAFDGRNIEKLEQALDCFRKDGNIHYQIICLKELGANYRQSQPEKAEKILNDAIALARQDGDTINMVNCLTDLAYLQFMQGSKKGNREYDKRAHKLLQQIKSLRASSWDLNTYATFACVYAELGMPDSATMFLQMAQENNNISDESTFLEARSIIAKSRGDSLNYLRMSHDCDRLAFASLSDPDIVDIMYAELSFDKEHQNQLEHKRLTRNYIIGGIVAAVILSLLLLALYLYRRTHRYDKLIAELKDQSQSQMNDLMGLQGNISEMKIKDESLKSFISSHMNMMREMIDACYHEPNNRIAENMKRIVKFQDSNRDNWVKLYDYIDLEHNDIMTRTRERYPQLDDKDLLLLALTTMRFSYIQTAIVMGYSNATSVSVLKQRLAQKMGIDCSLNEYIKKYSEPKND